ncbi:hypothetical protein [Blautia hansenii]|uniref:Uncharacterized protein n=1 Tax=Blautia hansenii DSM 20583 TaxID=537007 RepID=C9L7T2_BLAHA|nr:hypothetical protein [Blautia hansenii]ASM69762.1 hypothetical protein CGC63_09455 [Blautia hansenii DSM 20583]EEX21827.1 hypothetical protein BLAHAN_05452 [Blautia hansenii DSM 20583]UWO09514.1 hypothetical protein NQ538_09495 [Blautia hansenii DSM 20583]
MRNIFHRHRYKIIGTGDRLSLFTNEKDGLEVDIMCKCGKCGTVIVPESLRDKVLIQAAKGKYFNAPYIVSADRLM